MKRYDVDVWRWLICPLLQEVCESCDSSTEPKKACDPPFVNTRRFAVNCAEHVLSSNSDVLWLFGSWGIFSWFVVCSRSVNCCPDPCVVRSKLLFWLARRASWMTFPADTCFRVGGGFFIEGWRVSSVSTDVVSLRSLDKRKVHHFEWEICCPFCVFVCTTLCSMMRQMTSRTRCGSHSHLSCVTTIEAFVCETNACLDFFFLCTRCVQGVFNFSFFSDMKAFFFIGARTLLLRPTSRSKIVWRVPHVVPSMMVKNRTQFVKYQVQSIFENTHWCVTCVVVAASSHSVFKHARDRGIFSVAWSPVPLHWNTPLQQHVRWSFFL